MNPLRELEKHDVDLDLDFSDNRIFISLSIMTPKYFKFDDEYDLDVISKVSEESSVPVSEIILKGLFNELMELGMIISYENEQYIKRQITSYCEYCCLVD